MAKFQTQRATWPVISVLFVATFALLLSSVLAPSAFFTALLFMS